MRGTRSQQRTGNVGELQVGLGGVFEPNAAAFLFLCEPFCIQVFLNPASPSEFSKVGGHCVSS